jgi:hypothetical protein
MGEGQFLLKRLRPHRSLLDLRLELWLLIKNQVGFTGSFGGMLPKPTLIKMDQGSSVAFFGRFGARLGGNDRGGNNHSDKCEGNQEIMHWVLSLYVSRSSVHFWIIAGMRKNGNTTKT